MSEFSIDTGVPVPKRQPPAGRRAGESKYPFKELAEAFRKDPGSEPSFLVEQDEEGRPRRNSIGSSCTSWGRRFGIRFVAHQMEDGVRVWATAGDPPKPVGKKSQELAAKEPADFNTPEPDEAEDEFGDLM